MTKISIYPEIQVPTIDDLLIGTDVEHNDTTMNFKISDVLALAGAASLPYKSYVCLLNQVIEGTDPEATVIYNNIGTVTWTWNESGIYSATTAGLFTEFKTVGFCQVSCETGVPLWQTIQYNGKDPNNGVILVQFDVNGTYIDVLTDTMVEIRVYN